MAKQLRHQTGGDKLAADIIDKVTYPKTIISHKEKGTSVSEMEPFPVTIIDMNFAQEILAELKKINLQLSFLTDKIIEEEDL